MLAERARYVTRGRPWTRVLVPWTPCRVSLETSRLFAGQTTRQRSASQAVTRRPEYVPGYHRDIVSLQSLPGGRGVVLLDVFGGYTETWGGVHYSAAGVEPGGFLQAGAVS